MQSIRVRINKNYSHAKKQSITRESRNFGSFEIKKALTILRKYDDGELKAPKEKIKFVLKYEDCMNVVLELRKNLFIKNKAQSLFGQERRMFEALKNIYQTFDKNIYMPLLKSGGAFVLFSCQRPSVFDGNKR